MSPFHCRLRRLVVTQFRSYSHSKFDFDASFVGFVGDNGVGKTNLLEAMSLLSPGRGLRNARLSDMLPLVRSQDPAFSASWSVYSEVDSLLGMTPIGTGLAPKNFPEEPDKRTLRVNHKENVGQSVLETILTVVWLTPAMDGLLGESSSVRRRFLDKVVCGFNASHRQHLYRYEQTFRERAHLLKEGRFDKLWMKSLEETLAQEGVAITLERLELIEALNQMIQIQRSPFPQATLSLKGWLETLLQRRPALEVEEMVAGQLAQNRHREGGVTQDVGPHCSDLEVIHNETQRPVGLSSMGEQKAMLISVVLASMTLQVLKRNQTPIFLFDEGFVHLDHKRRSYLVEALRDLNIQTFFTSADGSAVMDLITKDDCVFQLTKTTPEAQSLDVTRVW